MENIKVINSFTMDFEPIAVNDDIIDELQCAINDVLLKRGFTPQGAIETTEAPVLWWKVTCSSFNSPLASKSWDAITHFIIHNVGLDYKIERQYTKDIPSDIRRIVIDIESTEWYSIK